MTYSLIGDVLISIGIGIGAVWFVVKTAYAGESFSNKDKMFWVAPLACVIIIVIGFLL